MLKLFFTFLLFLTLLSADDSLSLLSADKMMQTHQKSEVIKSYNSYKNIYARSLISGNSSVQKKSLKGIIASGSFLHIDVDRYKLKLKKISQIKRIKPKKKIIKSSRKIKKIMSYRDDTVTLKFKKAVSKKDVKYIWYYNKKSKQFIYRFTVNYHSISKNETIKINSALKVNLSPYRSGSSRVTLYSKNKLKLSYSIRNRNLLLKIHPYNSKKRVIREYKAKKLKKIASTSSYKKNFVVKTIVIDPGHGGKDSGAVGYKKYREKVIVLSIAKKLRDILRKSGHKVYMTRDNDTFIQLKDRTKFANRKNADIFISIHANAIPKKRSKKVYGIETYFLSPARSDRAKRAASKENAVDMKHMNYFSKQNYLSIMNSEKIIASHKLAIDLQQGLLSKLKPKYNKIKDAGVREAPFWVLVGAQMPAVLVEVGFISNPMEARRLVNERYKDYLAEGIAEGLLRYIAKNP